MIDLVIAAALAQAAGGAPDPCNAAGQPQGGRPGCPAWQHVRSGSMGGHEVEGYVDPASARRSGDMLELMTRNVMSRPGPDGISSMLVRVRLDCVRRTQSFVHVRAFDSAGILVTDHTPATPRVAPLGPDSAFNPYMARHCAG